MSRLADLCEEVLGEVEGGLEVIRHHSSLTTEALIDGAERLLEMAVLVEPLLPVRSDAMALTSAIQQVVVHLRLAYEERVLSMCTTPSGRGRPALDIHEEQL